MFAALIFSLSVTSSNELSALKNKSDPDSLNDTIWMASAWYV
jgi:hypothetical protein